MRTLLFLIFFLFLSLLLTADVKDYAVQASVSVLEDPPQLIFTWPSDNTADQYYVFKKAKTDTTWGDPIDILEADASFFVDNNIDIGEAFEYGFYKNLNNITDSITVENGRDLIFKIYDTWSDGISCHHGLGYYNVYGNEIIYASGGQFGAEEFTYFTVDGGNSTEFDNIIINIQLDVFGDETTWELEDEVTGDILLSGGPYSAPRFGHIFAGIKYPLVENRGTVLLLIDDVISPGLHNELVRLKEDLICDGWKVKRLEVSRFESTSSIREMIINEYQNDSSINSIFVIGHVPVPYSGNVMSAHTNHQGAHPADLYYAELDDVWTDETVNNTSATRPANHNIPGDGKFDQTFILSGVDLQIGRVDLYDMPAFESNELELLSNYLNKNHDFRYKNFTAEPRGFIDDNVGDLGGLAIAANGLRNFSAMFGSENITNGDYFSTLVNENYLWSLGCGPGSYTSCGGVGTTADFAEERVQTVFTMLYGSYFGDWDNTNNILKAPLASDINLLASFWAGAPAWHLHHMALGETIGYSTRISQNNIALYAPSDKARQIHTALMGDPTLRMHIVHPPQTVIVSENNNETTQITWEASQDNIEGYHIYRAISINDDFERITDLPLLDTSFEDINPINGNNVYMVRALKLENTGSGSYYNLSQGSIDSLAIVVTNIENVNNLPEFKNRLNQNYPNPFHLSKMKRSPETTISYSISKNTDVNLSVYNIAGQKIQTLFSGEKTKGEWKATWDGRDNKGNEVSSGIYFYKLSAKDFSLTGKMLLIK